MKKHILFTFLILLLSPYSYAEIPSTPTNLSLSSTSASITVKWNRNDDGDITKGYYVYYHKTDYPSDETRVTIPSASTASHTINGLSPNTKYTVKLSAYDGTDESGYDSEQITTEDMAVYAALTDIGELTVSIDVTGSNVVKYDIYISNETYTHDELDAATPIVSGVDSNAPYTISPLVNDTYYIHIITLDADNNEAGRSINNQVIVDDFQTFFSEASEAGNIENGCFISSSTSPPSPNILLVHVVFFVILFSLKTKPKKILLMSLVFLGIASSGYSENKPEYKNTIGIKGGYFTPSESDQADVYDRIIPFSLFYERSISKYFSADIEAGYSESDGKAITPGAGQTGIETELQLMPLSMSVNANIPITPLVNCFFGIGGDWWNYKEKSSVGEYEGDVGGWHAKTGVRLYTADTKYYKKVGVLLEVNYAQIDRFGKNDLDLGGWTYNLGLIYSF